MRFSDAELYDMPVKLLARIEDTMTARQFFKWTRFKLRSLIAESVKCKKWNEPKNRFLRNYRIKAISFYEEKIK